MPLSLDQVSALAPDAAALQAGRGLASARKWQELGGDDELLWGAIQGSGKLPYQVCVTFDGPAFDCSCPSRKIPCKHSLGLMLLAVDGTPRQSARPAWASEWLAARAERAAKAQARKESREQAVSGEAPPADTKARARRQQRRTGRIDEGATLLQQWLSDVMRRGLAAHDLLAAASAGGSLQHLAARMIDAQAPGLARRLRALGAELAAGAADAELRLLDGLGQLQLLLDAYRRRDEQPAEMQAELDLAVGATNWTDDLPPSARVRDQWFMAGYHTDVDDRLLVATSYLFGVASGRAAVLTEFSPKGQPRIALPLHLGHVHDVELEFSPGVATLRARRIDSKPPPAQPAPAPVLPSWSEFLAHYALGLAENPWRTQVPFLLRLRPGTGAGQPALVDDAGQAMPWQAGGEAHLTFLSLSAGAPTVACGVFDGYGARLVAACADEQWLTVGGHSA